MGGIPSRPKPRHPIAAKPLGNGSQRRVDPTVQNVIRQSLLQGTHSNSYLRTLRWYGVNFASGAEGKNAVGDCPFPDCPNQSGHFFVNPATGLWDCKRCGRSGNIYGFVEQLHQFYLKEMTDADYEALCHDRPGLIPEAVKHWRLAWCTALAEWWIPAWGQQNKKLNNVYVWREMPDEDDPTKPWTMQVRSGAIFKHVLYGANEISKDSSKPLWVCEGHWDFLALWGCFYVLKKLPEHDVVGLPGSNTIPQQSLSLMDKRDVRFLFDNDDAGRQGLSKIMKALANEGIQPLKTSYLDWPEVTPNKTDIRDVMAYGGPPPAIIKS